MKVIDEIGKGERKEKLGEKINDRIGKEVEKELDEEIIGKKGNEILDGIKVVVKKIGNEEGIGNEVMCVIEREDGVRERMDRKEEIMEGSGENGRGWNNIGKRLDIKEIGIGFGKVIKEKEDEIKGNEIGNGMEERWEIGLKEVRKWINESKRSDEGRNESGKLGIGDKS